MRSSQHYSALYRSVIKPVSPIRARSQRRNHETAPNAILIGGRCRPHADHTPGAKYLFMIFVWHVAAEVRVVCKELFMMAHTPAEYPRSANAGAARRRWRKCQALRHQALG